MSLIERLEAAEVGSRELDAAIWYALIETCGGKPDKDMIGRWPDYTTSLDAALALAERVLPGWHWELDNVGGSPYAANLTNPVGRFLICGDTEVYSTAPTPALALCIAILKAKETK